MVRSLSLSTFTSFGNSGVSGSDVSWRRHFKLIRKTHIKSEIPRQCLFHVPSFHFEANPYMFKKRGLRVEAGWPFQGGEQELEASSERSESANEDILIFFFQLDLATQVQRALNLEQYEIAQQLRNKLAAVEAEVIKQQEAKRGSSSKSEGQDKALTIVRLRGELQNAIENENYALAAQLRDEIQAGSRIFGCISKSIGI